MEMLRGITCCAALLSMGFSAEPVREVAYTAAFNATVPMFDKGFLVENPYGEEILVYGRDGSRIFSASIRPPSGVASVSSFAADSGGNTFAVSMGYRSDSGMGSGAIAFLDSSGRQVRTIDTGLFMPTHLCFTEDDTLWVLGCQVDPDRGETGRDYPVLRTYSKDGKETGRFVRRALFPRGLMPASPIHGPRGLQAARDRVGALIRPFEQFKEPRWLEVDLKGKLLGIWNLGQIADDYPVLIASGELYALSRPDREHPSELLRFDRARSKWQPSGLVLPLDERYGTFGMAWGGDGNNVVLSGSKSAGRLFWFAVE